MLQQQQKVRGVDTDDIVTANVLFGMVYQLWDQISDALIIVSLRLNCAASTQIQHAAHAITKHLQKPHNTHHIKCWNTKCNELLGCNLSLSNCSFFTLIITCSSNFYRTSTKKKSIYAEWTAVKGGREAM